MEAVFGDGWVGEGGVVCGVAGAGQVRQENLDPGGGGYYSLEERVVA